MYYVYDLVDSKGQTVYVGESKRPTGRMYDHRGRKNSPFYGRKDISIKIISEHQNRKEALLAEGQRKILLGFEWKEKTCGLKQDRVIRIANGKKCNALLTKEQRAKGGQWHIGHSGKLQECPYCGKEFFSKGLGFHIKAKH